jgi:hypothetical protein
MWLKNTVRRKWRVSTSVASRVNSSSPLLQGTSVSEARW